MAFSPAPCHSSPLRRTLQQRLASARHPSCPRGRGLTSESSHLDLWPRSHTCQKCDFTRQGPTSLLETHTDSTDSDDFLEDACQVLVLATPAPSSCATARRGIQIFPSRRLSWQPPNKRTAVAPHRIFQQHVSQVVRVSSVLSKLRLCSTTLMVCLHVRLLLLLRILKFA